MHKESYRRSDFKPLFYSRGSGQGTFCPRLWTECYIDSNGDVFACCRQGPCVLGNIYGEPLEVILTSKMAHKARCDSVAGRLGCFSDCVLLDKTKPGELLEGVRCKYSGFRRLVVEFGEACNLNCKMCWQDSTSRRELDFDMTVRNVELSPFAEIWIQGGEPLFISSARRFFSYAAAQGKAVSLVTNGMLITDVWAERIAQHSPFLHVSLNAATKQTHERVNLGSSWKTVLNNIQRVRQARRRLDGTVRIHGHMTIIPDNLSEVPLFIATFPSLGVDEIGFGYDKGMPAFFQAHPDVKHRVREQIRAEFQRCSNPADVDILRLSMLDLL